MKTIDDMAVQEWVDLDLDGELGPEDRARMAKQLEQSSELRDEKRQLKTLHAMLSENRIPVRSGFADQVMSALRPAAWERRLAERRTPAWAFPAGLAAVLAVGAFFALGSGGVDTHAVGIVAAVADLFKTTTLAGAGLLFATWRGVGFGLEELISGSGLSLAALAASVFFINLFFIQLLRRKPATAAEPAGSRRRG